MITHWLVSRHEEGETPKEVLVTMFPVDDSLYDDKLVITMKTEDATGYYVNRKIRMVLSVEE
jgi:hypothetical protein